MSQSLAATPTNIRQSGPATLAIDWADGHKSIYPVRELRLACTCAECVDEWSGENRLVESNVPTDVHPMQIEGVGRYAIQIHWSDGHATGIYSFDRLRELGEVS